MAVVVISRNGSSSPPNDLAGKYLEKSAAQHFHNLHIVGEGFNTGLDRVSEWDWGLSLDQKCEQHVRNDDLLTFLKMFVQMNMLYFYYRWVIAQNTKILKL